MSHQKVLAAVKSLAFSKTEQEINEFIHHEESHWLLTESLL